MLREERDPVGWALKALREAGQSLISELYSADEEILSRRPGEEEWCLNDIAGHIRDAEELALLQMSAILQGAGEPLPVRDIEGLPLERDYRSADLHNLLEGFRRLRRETTHLLWGISDAEWQAAAQHPYRGPITLGELARELAQHDLEHLWQARRLKHALGAGASAQDRGP